MKYKIVDTMVTDGDEILIKFEIISSPIGILKRSMSVPHDTTLDVVLEKINDMAYNDIEAAIANRERKEQKIAEKETRKAARDALKNEIDENIDNETVVKKPKDKP